MRCQGGCWLVTRPLTGSKRPVPGFSATASQNLTGRAAHRKGTPHVADLCTLRALTLCQRERPLASRRALDCFEGGVRYKAGWVATQA